MKTARIMRPNIGQQQHTSHHKQQFCVVDNCLNQQQQFAKNRLNLQQQTVTHLHQQQNYRHHQLQQHVIQQQQPPQPPPHMWSPHLNSVCYSSQPPTVTNGINSLINPSNNINLQSCRPFPTNRAYQYPTHPAHYSPSNSFPHAIQPVSSQGSERAPGTTPNYAKLPPLSAINQQRINECAGIPLISTATAHLTPGQRQRISRKQSHSPSGRNWSNILHGNAPQTYSSITHYAAAHVQGSPLIFNKQNQQSAEYWSPNVYASAKNQQHQQYFAHCNSKQQDRTRTPLRYQNSAPASLPSTKSKENLEQPLKHSRENENSSSNNGDSSNSTETCLPRIIKPRKRRKKDRKPPNNLVNAVFLKMDSKNLFDKSSNVYKSSEDLLKCPQKFTHSTHLTEEPPQPKNQFKQTGPSFEALLQNNNESTENIFRCTDGGSINHGICFCNGCDPLRCIWDYPLKRSLSDSSTSDTSGTGSLSDNTTSSTEFVAKPQCNWPKDRAEVVGVIGSKRNKDNLQSSYKTNSNVDMTPDNKCFNNILSGINLASEFFKHPNSTAFTNFDNDLTGPDNMILLPETAETLLTKSINEISKKLIETCSNESGDMPLSSCNSLSSFSITSSNSSLANSTCADFANDSGVESAHINAGDDLVFNFDNLHITTTKLSLSPSPLSSASSSSSSSSCGNLSMSSSPTVKFASNFLTMQTSAPATAVPSVSASVTNSNSRMQQTTPLTPNTAVMSTTINTAPTLDFLVDLNNNHLHVATPKAVIVTANKEQQKRQFNDLIENHQPPQLLQQQQQKQLHTTLMPTPTHKHDQQFFNNCFDMIWQQHERQLENKNIINNATNTPTTSATVNNNHIDEITSSNLTSNNVAMSSFLKSMESLKAVFSTIS